MAEAEIGSLVFLLLLLLLLLLLVSEADELASNEPICLVLCRVQLAKATAQALAKGSGHLISD